MCCAVQVRGAEAIKEFSQNLMRPYVPEQKGSPGQPDWAELQMEVARLRARIAELESQQKSVLALAS